MNALVLSNGWDTRIVRLVPNQLVHATDKPLLGAYTLEPIRESCVVDIRSAIDGHGPMGIAMPDNRHHLPVILHRGSSESPPSLTLTRTELRSVRPTVRSHGHKASDRETFVVVEMGDHCAALSRLVVLNGRGFAVIRPCMICTADIQPVVADVSGIATGPMEPGLIAVELDLLDRRTEVNANDFDRFRHVPETAVAVTMGEMSRQVLKQRARAVRYQPKRAASFGAEAVPTDPEAASNLGIRWDTAIGMTTDQTIPDGASARLAAQLDPVTTRHDTTSQRGGYLVGQRVAGHDPPVVDLPNDDRSARPSPAAVHLGTREDSSLPGRLSASTAAKHGWQLQDAAEVASWLSEREHRLQYHVKRIPFAELDGWVVHPDTGNIAHRSGRFFTIEGLDITVDGGSQNSYRNWQQPIIVQPEVGILGILVKKFDGVLHCLLQAKMEPGNPNPLQLSPTVQATHSNYTGVHNGAAVPYIDYFLGTRRGQVIADVLQSEHGSWFASKVNRNMIIEVDEEIPLRDGFCWLTLGQIGDLLRRDNVVNMDTRTVLACAPATSEEPGVLYSDAEVLSWFTAERSRYRVSARHIALADVTQWTRGEETIRHVRDWYFRVVAVSVQADSREVPQWSQPLLEPIRIGVTAFVLRHIAGVPHLLVHARAEGGFRNGIEMGPTVQCTPLYHEFEGPTRPPFLDVVRDAAPERILYSSIQSEEGGRLLNAENRYLIVEADESQAPSLPPEGYLWVTPGQLGSLLRHGYYVNIQARSLLAAINTGAVPL